MKECKWRKPDGSCLAAELFFKERGDKVIEVRMCCADRCSGKKTEDSK